MNEEIKNSLVVSNNNNQLSSGLFDDEQKVKKMTSINVSNESDADMLLNGMQDADFKLNECIGKSIKCIGVYAQEFETDTFNEETGEQITRKKHTLMLFDEDGKSYVTGSNACYMSFVDIIAIKGMPTRENPIVLIPIKVDAKEKGHSYLKLKIGKEVK